MGRVSLKNVTKVYPGGVRAVDGIDLEIADREFVVLVGPSGCGKSTTLRMVAGLEDASGGTICIGEREVTDVAPKNRDIAMVFQNYALYPHMTVYKNMAFGLSLRRRQLGLTRADIDKKVRDAATLLGIDDLLERKPRALSGGQRQRVAVGRAIVRTPQVFLFDEPLSNLDAKLRVEMRSEIKGLQRRLATTTIYVTHDQEEAMTLGDRVVVMKNGVIQQCAPPLEIYERPANRFVAGFIGMPPMNFMDGRVAFRDGASYFDGLGATLRLPREFEPRLAKFADREMTLGVRPDALSLAENGTTGIDKKGLGERFDVQVTLVETLGDRKDVFMTTEGRHQWVARVDSRVDVAEGRKMDAFVDMSRAHVFERGELGVNVTAIASTGAATGE